MYQPWFAVYIALNAFMSPHEHSIVIEPQGRPHLQCAKCRMTVVWPDGLAEEAKAEFASIVRADSVRGIDFANTQFGLNHREAKVLVLHVTRESHQCHKCGKSVQGSESVCTCRSVNLDW
jgi:hypothetical protein